MKNYFLKMYRSCSSLFKSSNLKKTLAIKITEGSQLYGISLDDLLEVDHVIDEHETLKNQHNAKLQE